MIFLRSASTIKSFFPPSNSNSCIAVDTAQVRYSSSASLQGWVGRYDEVEIRFASPMLAELTAGNWGWVYRVGLAGIAAAAGLGLGNLTAQPLHLVKERNFECAENRRKRKYKKKASLFLCLTATYASTLKQMGGESLTINHTYHSRAATDEMKPVLPMSKVTSMILLEHHTSTYTHAFSQFPPTYPSKSMSSAAIGALPRAPGAKVAMLDVQI